MNPLLRRLVMVTLAALIVLGTVLTATLGAASPSYAAEELRNAVDAKLKTEYGQKLDLNNANVQAFRKYRGMYPTLAGKVLQNAPFNAVEDVLEMPELSEREIEILQMNLPNFTVTPPTAAFVEGGDRFNNGVYK